MKQTAPFITTISRQLGCGGAYVGHELAKRLNVSYADREIIRKAAKYFSTLDESVESRDEKLLSFWQSFIQNSTTVPGVYVPPEMIAPTDRELFEIEAKIIEHIAKKRSAVIIGRCGFHVLREYPNHVSIFLHSDIACRNERIQKLYNSSKESAGKMIAQSDKNRALYCKTFTGKEWTDTRNYNISIDTSKMDIDKIVEFILRYLELI